MGAARVHFRAGVATVDITPDPERQRVELSGYVAREQPADGVRDRLLGTVLVIAGSDEAEPTAIVGLDLCILSAAAVERITQAGPLPPERVLLVCSHSHSAPATYPLIGCGDPDPAYARSLAVRVGDAIRRAIMAMVPCRLGWGRRAVAPVLWGNRRDPAGATDPRIQLLKIERSDSARDPVCALWSLACHPVTLGPDARRVSADWVGEVRRALPWPSLFLQGFAGDQNPLARGEDACRAFADMAPTMIGLWDATLTAASGPFGWARGAVELPRLPGMVLEGPPPGGRPGAAIGRWLQDVARPGEPIPPTPATVVAWRAHNGRAVFWPGEPHMALASALPPDTLAVGHSGASVGYVPERAAYARPGYEAGQAHMYYGFPSALAPEAGDALVAKSQALLAALG